jgi:hypothetical protein
VPPRAFTKSIRTVWVPSAITRVLAGVSATEAVGTVGVVGVDLLCVHAASAPAARAAASVQNRTM